MEKNQETEGDLAADLLSVSNVYVNKTREAKPLVLGDKKFDTGFYVEHGSQSWSYQLDGKCVGLSAALGQINPGGGQVVRYLADAEKHR